MNLFRKQTHHGLRIRHTDLHLIRMNIDIQCSRIHRQMQNTERKSVHHKKCLISLFHAFGDLFGPDIAVIDKIILIASVCSCNHRSSQISFHPDAVFFHLDRNQFIGCTFAVNTVNNFF